MYYAYRQCPECNRVIQHTSKGNQASADNIAKLAIVNKRLCLSCARSGDRNPSKLPHVRDARSKFLKQNNPSAGKPAWNRNVPRPIETKEKMRNTIQKNGGRESHRNANYGKFKEHSINLDFKLYSQRVRVLTERNKHLIPNYDQALRGRVGISGAYQIDHIKSILQCWYEGIDPEVAAAIDNLQFIPWQENLHKRRWIKKNIN